ncbi:nickel-dependent lactate racemase [Marispirochaeta aestuarii]|uniref:nickel-dependent lactate racemase n=1 Tax=Marispirochaeta aestuarii TaxID=1963862 RepID=UPI0029C7B159|nr:nickel-dependent lactate racemase [Marispirochaeta aestuarii]
MKTRHVSLPYGDTEVGVDIPEENIIGVYSPEEVPPVSDIRREVRRALENPIGSGRLDELARGKKRVVIVADDNTRLTPADLILPPVLDALNAAGVPDSAVTLIIALGTHRFMTDEEILKKFGPEVVRRITIRNHPFRDLDSLVDLGTTENGTKIMINREVCEADFVIGVGSIVPHHIPGFAGGSKIIQPGVSGEDTTAETHLLSVRAPRSYLGVLENPVRRELDSIARKVGLNIIFNTVLNRYGEVVEAFFGDVEAAFRKGVERSKKVFSVNIPQAADIVVSSSHPCDIEFWQAHKTLYPSDLAVKEKGIIIIVTPCYEGVAMTHDDILEVTGESSGRLREMVERGEVRDKVAAALAIAWAQVKERETVFIVSHGIDKETADKLGFIHFSSVQEALDEALRRKGSTAGITVLTHAADMLPVLD